MTYRTKTAGIGRSSPEVCSNHKFISKQCIVIEILCHQSAYQVACFLFTGIHYAMGNKVLSSYFAAYEAVAIMRKTHR